MIFQHTWRQVLDGAKTQTRRRYDAFSRTRYEVGKTYAVQPGRGQKAVGRIRITAIRLERIRDINHGDCMAEGLTEPPYPSYDSIIENFAELWNSIHRKRGERWQDNPLVWVLSFELVEE